jgi:hypothetical protein
MGRDTANVTELLADIFLNSTFAPNKVTLHAYLLEFLRVHSFDTRLYMCECVYLLPRSKLSATQSCERLRFVSTM